MPDKGAEAQQCLDFYSCSDFKIPQVTLIKSSLLSGVPTRGVSGSQREVALRGGAGAEWGRECRQRHCRGPLPSRTAAYRSLRS